MHKTISALGPRTQPNAKAPGSYEVAVRVINPLLAPGDILEVDFFFSGYGEISRPKLYFFPSTSVFDTYQSVVHTSMRFGPDRSPAWGGQTYPLLSDQPLLLAFEGLKHPEWLESTCFVDADDDTNLVLTEMPLGGHAPVELRFKTLSSIEPGRYYIELTFSYYDGQKWRSSVKRVEFAVTSFLERHQRKLAWYGIVASLVGLGSSIAKFFY